VLISVSGQPGRHHRGVTTRRVWVDVPLVLF